MPDQPLRPGPHNDLTDVAGLRVGHATRTGSGWLTGCTVVLTEPGTTGGVDVRGGGPGTRETDLLDPRNLVDAVDAVVLSGGSAFGLRTADGVMDHLYAAGRGWPVGSPGEVVPIVPAAILFDLGRGGSFANHPRPEDGAAACLAADTGPVAQGCVGAGTGARAGGLKGGLGSASAVLPDGTTVAALVAVNSVGLPFEPRTGRLPALRVGLPGEFDAVPAPRPDRVAALLAELAERRAAPSVGTATTIGVVATDATLTKAGCATLAAVAHDGLARAVSPVHTAFDGDTFFALATGARPSPEPMATLALQHAAADCVTRAIGHALLAATSVPGGDRSWQDALT